MFYEHSVFARLSTSMSLRPPRPPCLGLIHLSALGVGTLEKINRRATKKEMCRVGTHTAHSWRNMTLGIEANRGIFGSSNSYFGCSPEGVQRLPTSLSSSTASTSCLGPDTYYIGGRARNFSLYFGPNSRGQSRCGRSTQRMRGLRRKSHFSDR